MNGGVPVNGIMEFRMQKKRRTRTMELMTIGDYFKNEKEVYIQNKTKPLGVISLALGEKGEISYLVPKTTKPIILTDFVPKEQVEKSVNFREMVKKGVIGLLTKEEYERAINNEEKQIQTTSTASQMESSLDASAAAQIEQETITDVNPRIIQLVHLLGLKGKGEDIEGAIPTQDAVIAELETMDLTEQDLNFLLANTKGKLRKWTKTKLEALVIEKASQ